MSVHTVHCDPKTNPILSNFECSLQSSKKNFKCQYFQDRKRKLAAIATEDFIYSGHVQFPTESQYRTLIGIRKKDSKKIVLHEVNTCSLSATRKPPSIQDDSKVLIKEEKHAKHINLNKTFGTKKAKRSIEVRERMKIDSEAISRDKMNLTIANVDTTANESELLNTQSRQNRTRSRRKI